VTQLEALGISLGVEVPVVMALGLALGCAPVSRLLVAALAATLLTHPLAWTAAEALAGEVPSAVRAGLVEGGVIALEALVFRFALGTGWARALLLSVAANLASYGVGVWIQS
jgi:hypothetical protein